jgi:predicted nucleic acid-binding protein
MADCALDANVIVAWIDAADVLHVRATALLAKLARDGLEPVIPDVTFNEAVSVLCRRFRERKRPGDLAATLVELRLRIDASQILWVSSDAEPLWDRILDLVATTAGRLNFNDALLVLLQRAGRIGPLATFDSGFRAVADFKVIDDT